MNRIVFISHSNRDLPMAQRVARELALRGFGCRIASPEKRTESGPLTELARDLNQAQAGIVIATRAAERSGQVLREVEWLIVHDRTVLVLKPDDVKLEGTLGELLRAAPVFSIPSKSSGSSFNQLASELRTLGLVPLQATRPTRPAQLTPAPRSQMLRWRWAVIAVSAVICFGFVLSLSGPPTAKNQQFRLPGDGPMKSLSEISPVSNQESVVKVASLPIGLPRELTNSMGIKFVLIPAGSFTRFSPARPTESATVTLTKPYYLGITEINQKQFSELMGEPASFYLGELLPVDHATWGQAFEFCRRLSELPEEKAAGRSYRLPTEAEWEFASRAGSGKAHFFGDNIKEAERFVWFSDNSGKEPHAVGVKLPNAWGLYDIYGNSHEWCSDWAADYPAEGQIDPQGPETGERKVIRGGGAHDQIWVTSSLWRKWSEIDSPTSGFRIVCEVATTESVEPEQK